MLHTRRHIGRLVFHEGRWTLIITQQKRDHIGRYIL